MSRQPRAMVERFNEVEECRCRERKTKREQQQPPFRVLLDSLQSATKLVSLGRFSLYGCRDPVDPNQADRHTAAR